MLIYNNPTEAFEKLYRMITDEGVRVQDTLALFNVSMKILDPMNNEVITSWRKFNKQYSKWEYDMFQIGSTQSDMFANCARIWGTMGNPLNSNYGNQLQRNEQLGYLVNELYKDKESRRAWVTIFDAKEHEKYADDTPCCLGFGCRITDDRLHMTVNFRSMDLWFGWATDQFVFSNYLHLIWRVLSYKKIYPDLKIGTIVWNVANIHLYKNQLDRDYE